MPKTTCLFLLFISIVFLSTIAEATQVDFGWSPPEYFVYKEGTPDEKKYLVWFYSLRNTTDKEILIPFETFLNTDTKKNYEDIYVPEIASEFAEEGEVYLHSMDIRGEFGSGVTKKGIAIFEDVDSYAQRINIFATGLSHFFFWRWRLVDCSYKIIYKKSGDKWILEEQGFNKDDSHRNFVDKIK